MKAYLIINPSSGGELAKTYEEKFLKKLLTVFEDVQIFYTEKAGDATLFAKKACADKVHSVFAMGGDGTVNEVVNGLASETYRPKFGFLPLGTVNDLARALQIPLDVEQAIEQFDSERFKSIDIGKVNDHYFVNVVAVGTIPQAVNNVAVEQKTKFGKLAYVFSGISELMNNTCYEFEISIDNHSLTIQSSLILVGLTNSIGGLEHLLPEAKVNDGYLHIAYLKDQQLIDTIKAVPQLLGGITSSSNNLEYCTAKMITIKSHKNNDLISNVDGDEGDLLPLNIQILPNYISIYY